MTNRKKIYSKILDLLSPAPMTREALINGAASYFNGMCPGRECPVGPASELRGEVGAVVTEMTEDGIISVEGDKLSLISSRPAALRAESCEREIITLLSREPLSKRDIREALIKRFGTDKTASTRDDSILFSLIGQVIKRLSTRGIIITDGGLYKIAPEKAARLDDINEMLAIKSDFFARLHAKGGEFFEHYILTLLSRHLEKSGKTVTESYVTGGSADGGIDGVIKTVDTLGFREHLMIQAKNRLELTNETTVRSFYGAVCAAQGSRGIFATTSDFHPSAAKFLEGIDNCVGVNADTIFRLACECQYGVRRKEGKLVIDTRMLS